MRGKPRKGNAASRGTRGSAILSRDDAEPAGKPRHHGAGHRARLRARLLNGGAEALADYEVLEYLLFSALKIAALAARRMARSEVRQKPVLGSWQALLDYLAIDMANLTVERVRVLYLNSRNQLILDHELGDGTIDEAAIYPREVIRRGLDVGATALILVHNHPSGNPEPSRADIQITQRIGEAGKFLGITVHDHLIVGREGHVSLRAKGLI